MNQERGDQATRAARSDAPKSSWSGLSRVPADLGPETLAPCASDPFSTSISEPGFAAEEPRGDEKNEGGFPMARFARIAAALGALAAIFLVAGAGTNY